MSNRNRFESWATSFSGYDGGGLRENGIWVCGIEGGRLKAGTSSELVIPDPVTVFPSWPSDKNVDYLSGTGTRYDRKIAKVLACSAGRSISELENFAEEVRLFTEASAYAKFNLYPFNFNTVDAHLWTSIYAEITGFADKAAYRNWCREHRFPNLNRMRQRYRPRLIVCTGVTYTMDFLNAFGEEGQSITPIQPEGNASPLIKRCSRFSIDGNTSLFVLPLYGRNGIRSDAEVAEVGRWINLNIKP